MRDELRMIHTPVPKLFLQNYVWITPLEILQDMCSEKSLKLQRFKHLVPYTIVKISCMTK